MNNPSCSTSSSSSNLSISELNERLCSDLEQSKRIARTLTLHASAFKSRCKKTPLTYFKLDSCVVMTQGTHYNGWRITPLSISASKIMPIPSVLQSSWKE
ncbi:hypothetical protein QYF36_025517 [Acer negundo]|nr:hypothetical protein QYF36_025517 [Acer negundo]